MEIIYKDEKDFTKENILKLFLSVDWQLSASNPDKLYTALINSPTVFTAWENNKLVGLARALDDGILTAYIHYVLKILTYVFVSVMACFAGVIYGARFATVQPAIGTGSEMNIIAAVIVGGTSMMGGVGTIVGTVIGSVLMAMITNVLIMLGVSAYWQAFVFGFILIVSLFIDRYRQRSLNA